MSNLLSALVVWQVQEQRERLATQYRTTDLSIVTICYDYAVRARSDELVAEACRIKR